MGAQLENGQTAVRTAERDLEPIQFVLSVVLDLHIQVAQRVMDRPTS